MTTQATHYVDKLSLQTPSDLDGILGRAARALQAETNQKLARVRDQLKSGLPALIVNEMAKLNEIDCSCRREWTKHLEGGMKDKISSLEFTKARLTAFTHRSYMSIVIELTAEVRIFLGANAIVLLLLSVLTFLKKRAVEHLLLPGFLMLISTMLCSYFYIFEQDWVYSILFSDYTGYGYLIYLLVVFALLCDIAINRARVTTSIINWILRAVSGANPISPC